MSTPADLLDLQRRVAALEERLGAGQRLQREPTVSAIVADAALLMDLPAVQIVSRRRGGFFRARCAVSWVARRVTDYSLERIGGALGIFNHTSVMHQLETAEHLRATDPAFDLLTILLRERAEERREAFLARVREAA